MSTDKLSQK